MVLLLRARRREHSRTRTRVQAPARNQSRGTQCLDLPDVLTISTRLLLRERKERIIARLNGNQRMFLGRGTSRHYLSN